MNNNLLIFLISQIAAAFSYNLIFSAINFHVLDTTNSALKFAMMLVIGSLPKIFFTQLSGIISDYFDKRKFYVLIDLIYASSILIILFFRKESYLALAIINIVLNITKSLSVPITKSIVPAIVEEKDRLKANSYEVSNDKIARIFGPIAALATLAAFSFRTALVISCVIYLVTAYLKSLLIISKIESKNENKSEKLNIFQEIKEGIYTLSDTSVLLLLLNAVVTQIFFHPFVYTIFPILFHNLTKSEAGSILNILSFLHQESSVLWKSMNAWIQLGAALGVFVSIYYVAKIKKIDEDRGLNLGLIGISISGLFTILAIYIFKIYSISTFLFVNILFVTQAFLMFFFNIFTIFFSSYYQKHIERKKLGRFIANTMMLFSISATIGTALYGFCSSWQRALLLLFIGVILKILLQIAFIYTRRKNV